MTFQRLFLCLSSSSSSLLFSAAVSLQHWKPSIHPSKTVGSGRLLCACAQVLPIGVGGTFDRPRKTLIKKPLNGGRDRRRHRRLSSFPEAFGAGADVAPSKSVRREVRHHRGRRVTLLTSFLPNIVAARSLWTNLAWRRSTECGRQSYSASLLPPSLPTRRRRTSEWPPPAAAEPHQRNEEGELTFSVSH